MKTEFILPDIGEGIIECEVVEWLVQEGQLIQEDDAVVDVMSDKALVQIPTPFTGKVTKIYYQKGEIAKVHEPLFQIEVQPVASKDVSSELLQNVESGVVSLELASSPKSAELTEEEFAKHVYDMPLDDAQEEKLLSVAGSDTVTQKALASPAVRRLAKHYEIDLNQVAGSGKHGRVYKEDIEAYQKHSPPSATLLPSLEKEQLTAYDYRWPKRWQLRRKIYLILRTVTDFR